MRYQLIEANNNCLLITDRYHTDTASLATALEFLNQFAGEYKRTVILSDLFENGKTNEQLYQAVAKNLEEMKIDKFIGIGPAIGSQQKLFKQTDIKFYNDIKSFISNENEYDFKNEIILLKGAYDFAFEKISIWLVKKVHQTVFEVNLNALLHNLNVYRNQLDPSVKIMAMVKAFSYGTGCYEIASLLANNRVDYLAVAYADEGVTLRKAGIKTPILVMNPEENSYDAISKYNLEPEVYHSGIIEKLIVSAPGEEIGIHIKLETGMKRLGFEENQLSALIAQIKENPFLKIKSVFTHLAATEAPEHDEFTRKQIQIFEKMTAQICKEFNYPILKHCLNSSGIVRFKEAHFDMVRPGIGLYGVDTSGIIQDQLQNIGSLKTVISQLRDIKKEESIGYGRKGYLKKDGKIAVVAIGYADGLNRKLSNGNGYMMIHGHIAPIVGNICMDMTMLDVSHISCKVGDEVTVFGERPDISEISEKIGTIPYEVLTGISQRVKRIYLYG